jgi:hypothetical protein
MEPDTPGGSGLPELDAADMVRLAPLFAADDEASRHYPKLSAEQMAFASAHVASSNRTSRLLRHPR